MQAMLFHDMFQFVEHTGNITPFMITAIASVFPRLTAAKTCTYLGFITNLLQIYQFKFRLHLNLHPMFPMKFKHLLNTVEPVPRDRQWEVTKEVGSDLSLCSKTIQSKKHSECS